MSSERGFSLIETLVAILVAALIVISAGLLGTRTFHRRTTSTSLSAATALATQRVEELRPLRVPWTSLANGTTTTLVDGSGSASIGGPYSRTTIVSDGPIIGTAALKRVTVTVQHVTNADVRVTLTTYFRVSA